MKKIISLVLLTLLSLTIVGCTVEKPTSTNSTAPFGENGTIPGMGPNSGNVDKNNT